MAYEEPQMPLTRRFSEHCAWCNKSFQVGMTVYTYDPTAELMFCSMACMEATPVWQGLDRSAKCWEVHILRLNEE